MYIENDKISNRQTFRLYVFDLIGIATLILPPMLARICGMDGVISILIGALASLGYLMYLRWTMQKMQTDFICFLREHVHPWVGKGILFFIGVHCIFSSGFCAFVFTRLMRYSLVSDTSYHFILFVIIVTAVYAVKGGIECRARVYEVLFWFVLIPYVAMMLVSTRGVKLRYLSGFFETDWLEILKGGYLVSLLMTPLFFSLFLKEREEKGGKIFIGAIRKAVILASVILLGSYVLLVGNFGGRALSTMQFPVVTLMSTIQFEGTFVKRMDAIMLSVWFFTLFALLNLHLHYAKKMLKEVFRKQKSEIKELVISAAGCYLIASVMESDEKWMHLFFDYYLYVATPFMLILPIVVLMIRRYKCEK